VPWADGCPALVEGAQAGARERQEDYQRHAQEAGGQMIVQKQVAAEKLLSERPCQRLLGLTFDFD
jgi:hypothetical protein